MSPHAVTYQLPRIKLTAELKEFAVTSNAFLPEHSPLKQLPDSYYEPWELVIQHLPALIKYFDIRRAVDTLPVLSTERLRSEAEWRRAYSILAFLTHAYVWGGEKPAQILPPQITVPFLAVSKHLELPPVLSYAAANLWNFSSSSNDFTDLDHLDTLHTFTGTESEKWFLLISVAMEARAGTIIPKMMEALEAVKTRDYDVIISALEQLKSCIDSVGVLLERMYEKCDPMTFYYKIRPFLAGSKNMEAAGLPKGVFYDEGDGKGEWRHLRGGSNGQSSLIQFFDVVLGVEHITSGNNTEKAGERSYHDIVKDYMPGPHRRFLTHVARKGSIRELASQTPSSPAQERLQAAFTAATEALTVFRNKHIQIVTRYIILPARSGRKDGPQNLASSSSKKNGEELTGTGGTTLVPFLKQSRDETSEAGRLDLDQITIIMADQAKPDDHVASAKLSVESHPESRAAAAFAMDSQHRQAVEKSMKRKLDTRCALFVLIYIMNYLDRNNMAAARLKGLQEDLNLSYNQYATCLSILYVGYILMQVPSNMFINRIQRPSLYISAAMLLWGLISTLSGSVHNFAGMVCIRFFLGFVEAAFLPGALLILSKWYTRRELTKRNAILFCGNLISNAFSALVGAGVLSNMQGVLGHAAWRWLFWIEGAITMSIAISAAFILPDLPHNSRGFTEEERQVAQLRMIEDVGEADEDSSEESAFYGLKLAVKDLKIYIMMLTFTAYVVGLSFNAFFPSLTETLGFGYVPTLLMSAPPWVFSCIVSVINAWHSDRTQEKFWHIVGPIGIGTTGFIISMATENVAARYLALFLQAASYAGFIVFYSWISSSFPRPPAKRAVAIAMINAFSQLGNVAGSYVWDLKENGYRKSYGIVLSMFGVTVVGCYIFRLVLIDLNKKLERGEANAWETRQDVAAHTAAVEVMDSPDEALRMKRDFRYLI
ncbi:Indoleamine 2,3-dioxygenase-domain-containing protein [Fusarium oxysporum]|nr:Indoleamine 2,3-dioxygenase-domain-containing protein [Fusarium oxysporum]